MHVCMSCRLQTHSYVCIYQALIANPLDLAQSLAVHVQAHTINISHSSSTWLKKISTTDATVFSGK